MQEEYWKNLKPATGRPYSAAFAHIDQEKL